MSRLEWAQAVPLATDLLAVRGVPHEADDFRVWDYPQRHKLSPACAEAIAAVDSKGLDARRSVYSATKAPRNGARSRAGAAWIPRLCRRLERTRGTPKRGYLCLSSPISQFVRCPI